MDGQPGVFVILQCAYEGGGIKLFGGCTDNQGHRQPRPHLLDIIARILRPLRQHRLHTDAQAVAAVFLDGEHDMFATAHHFCQSIE